MSKKTETKRVAKNPAAKNRVAKAAAKTNPTKKVEEKMEVEKSVLAGRTRIKALAILQTLKANKDGLTNKALRHEAKFPCMAKVLTDLVEQGLIKQEVREGVRGFVFTVYYRGKVLASPAKALKEATAEELKAAAAGHAKREQLATWEGVSGYAKRAAGKAK